MSTVSPTIAQWEYSLQQQYNGSVLTGKTAFDGGYRSFDGPVNLADEAGEQLASKTPREAVVEAIEHLRAKDAAGAVIMRERIGGGAGQALTGHFEVVPITTPGNEGRFMLDRYAPLRKDVAAIIDARGNGIVGVHVPKVDASLNRVVGEVVSVNAASRLTEETFAHLAPVTGAAAEGTGAARGLFGMSRGLTIGLGVAAVGVGLIGAALYQGSRNG